MRLSDFSLRRPITVLVCTAAVLVLGAVSMQRLKLDFLPKIDFPFVAVWIPYPNAVPEQVERDIVRPIEETMATLGELRELSSWAGRDGAWVNLEFDFGPSVDILRLEVQEKMEQVRPLLPADLPDYFVFTFNSADIPVMVGRISSRGRDLAGSYDLLERRIINPLRRVEGVGRVTVDGIAPKDVTIYLLLDRIIAHNVDIGRLFRTLNDSNMDLSLGRLNDGRQRISVRSIGQFRSLAEIEELEVGPAGIRLKDVAEIVYREPAPNYYRHLNGEPAIAFEIQKASGANVVDVSRAVSGVLSEIEKDPALQGIDVVLFFDQASQILESLRGLLMSGLIGSLMAIAILYFFLRRVKATLVVSTAIPLCVIGTCAFLYLTGRSLNVLTMMGLMLAVGMLVDNAIVVLESIYRRQELGEDSASAARNGARDVAVAVTASTLTSIIVFAPIVLTKGDELAVWLGEVGVTISVTLIFSLLVCLSLVPMLASRIRTNGGVREFRILSRARERYLRILRWTALRHPRMTGWLFIPLFLVLTVGAIKVSGFGPDEMSDDSAGIRQENIYVELEFTDNSNVYRVREVVETVETFLEAKQDSLQVEYLYFYYQDNFAAFSLYFQEGYKLNTEKVRELREYLREELPVLAGSKYHFSGDDGGAALGTQTLSVTLFGEDTAHLEGLAAEAERRLLLLDSMQELGSDLDEGTDEVRIILDRQLAGRYGVSPRDLSQILGLTFRGVPLRKFQGSDREIDLGIVLEPSDRRNIDNLSRLPVTYREGRPILLGQLARFEVGKGPQGIRRQNQKTALTITGTYEGDEFGDLTEQVTEIMDSIEMPAGYSWSYGRRMRQAQEQQNEMGMNILLAFACVYLVMAALFESYLHPLVIMLCIPFAAFGVIWTLLLTGTPFNLFAMIGMVILTGVVVNNGIVLLDHVNHLRQGGMPRDEAIINGCRDRFRPILMTALTTILGLAPLALGKTAVADAYYFPLARAVMGGLATSTVLTLVVLPTFYVLAEDMSIKVKRLVDWGLGRRPLPWRERPAEDAGTELA